MRLVTKEAHYKKYKTARPAATFQPKTTLFCSESQKPGQRLETVFQKVF